MRILRSFLLLALLAALVGGCTERSDEPVGRMGAGHPITSSNICDLLPRQLVRNTLGFDPENAVAAVSTDDPRFVVCQGLDEDGMPYDQAAFGRAEIDSATLLHTSDYLDPKKVRGFGGEALWFWSVHNWLLAERGEQKFIITAPENITRPAKLRPLIKKMAERSPVVQVRADDLPPACPAAKSKTIRAVLGKKSGLAQGGRSHGVLWCHYATETGTTITLRQETGTRAQIRESIETQQTSPYYKRSNWQGNQFFDDWSHVTEALGEIHIFPKNHPRMRTIVKVFVDGADGLSTRNHISVKQAINLAVEYVRFLDR